MDIKDIKEVTRLAEIEFEKMQNSKHLNSVQKAKAKIIRLHILDFKSQL